MYRKRQADTHTRAHTDTLSDTCTNIHWDTEGHAETHTHTAHSRGNGHTRTLLNNIWPVHNVLSKCLFGRAAAEGL